MPRHPSKVGSWRKNSQKLEVGYLFFLLAIFFYSLPIVGLVLIFRVWGYMGYPHLLLRFFCAKMPIKDTEVLSAVKAIRMVMASSEFQTRPPTPCYVGQGWDPTLITNQQEYVDVSENSGFSPQIIHFNRVFHYKPSILGYPYFWKHPCRCAAKKQASSILRLQQQNILAQPLWDLLICSRMLLLSKFSIVLARSLQQKPIV